VARPGRRSLKPLLERMESVCLLSVNMVLRWNTVAIDAGAVDHSGGTPSQGGPTRTARALAIVQTAVFDAVNAIDRQYQPYAVPRRAPRDASSKAAVAQAAHDTLAALYPDQKATFDRVLRRSLAVVPDGLTEDLGRATGRFAAKKILKARADDGARIDPAYSEPVAAGVFQVFPGEPDALTPGWGDVKPFAMNTAAAFMAPPSPEMTGAEYAAAYDEVKRLGGDGVTTTTERTAEQTEIGLFWAYDGTPGLGTPPRLYNQIVQAIARQQGNTLVQTARLFALVNIAMADAGCAGWGTKYTFDVWRPIRGIRQQDAAGNVLDDGNPSTEADPTWTPLGAPCTNCPPGQTGFTPPFPAYVSGHATFGASVFETLKNFYGRDDIRFTFTSDELDGRSRDPDGTVRPLRPRTFTSFSQAAEENGQSRIYLGIHWKFDKDQGITQGNAIADYVFSHVLTPL
jgi:hypothetical protein